MSDAQRNAGAVCALASGGLDSCVMTARLAESYPVVQPLFVRCGLTWEEQELAALRAFVERLGREAIRAPAVVSGRMDDLYGDHWSITGREVPDETSSNEAVYLPGRNLVFLAKASVYCNLHNMGTLALGLLKSNPFSDASDPFFRSFEQTAAIALGHSVSIITPLANLDKAAVLALGREMPLEATFSCIHPVNSGHCGRCNKCYERKQAFRACGQQDLTPYAE